MKKKCHTIFVLDHIQNECESTVQDKGRIKLLISQLRDVDTEKKQKHLYPYITRSSNQANGLQNISLVKLNKRKKKCHL